MSVHLFSDLRRHGDALCLMSDETRLTYTDVAQAADALYRTNEMPRGGLAFLHAHNSTDALIAYVGAVRHGFAVHLLDPAKTEANRRLIDLYKPDVVADTNRDDPIEIRGPGDGIHPEISILLSTSGSTGAAKFVKLTNGNIVSNTLAICDYLKLQPTDRGIMSLKFFYSYGMSVVNTHLTAGASLVVTDLSADDPAFWDLVANAEVTNIAGVPFTFELMHRSKIDLGRYPSLRFLTQAGGKLSPDLVRHFAVEGEKRGTEFYVMYGQTEAAPRMSYLPPDLARTAPGSIGKAIPGGKLYVVDEAHVAVTEPDTSGELVYEGPNVMAGYAESRKDLAVIETIPALYTGDIAHFDERGLFYIDGRSARFVKPFGLRVSLDEIERVLRENHTVVAATGTDNRIVLAVEDSIEDGAAMVTDLAARFGLPQGIFTVVSGRPIPRLSNGKPDYKSILAPHNAEAAKIPLAQYFIREVWGLLSGHASPPSSVLDAFRTVLGDRIRDRNMTFRSAGGDSLTYMQIYLLLEEYMGEPPEDWADTTIAELEHLKGASFV